jgi:hypothetical protein
VFTNKLMSTKFNSDLSPNERKPTHESRIPIVIPIPLRGLVIAGTGSILKVGSAAVS